jgi:hypothetical protein
MSVTDPRKLDQAEEAELVRLGIERVITHRFHWSGYRYDHARDAIAAARRGERP